jgi:hypothetical protein
MDERALDAGELPESVKAGGKAPQWVPLAPSNDMEKWRRWPMRAEESLDYLHRNWILPDRLDPQVTGTGFKGRLISVLGRIVFRVLGPYLRDERELLANLVRTNDTLARRCDELSKVISNHEVAQAENEAKLAAWLHHELRHRSVGEEHPSSIG